MFLVADQSTVFLSQVTLICLVATVWARLQSSRDRGIPESWFGRDTFFEDEIGGQEAALERQDQEEAATNERKSNPVFLFLSHARDEPIIISFCDSICNLGKNQS